MSMNEYLADMYGTAGNEAPEEDFEKQAQAEFFAKLASDAGIDLNTLSDGQIVELWNDTFDKVAEGEEAPPAKKKDDEEDDDDDEEEKKAAAYQEWEANQAWQQKIAEHDFLGRQMAHAYVDEMNKIAAEMDKEAKDPYGEALGAQIAARQKRKLRKGQHGAAPLGETGAKGPSAAVDKSHMGKADKAKSLGRRGWKAVKGGAKELTKTKGRKAALIASGMGLAAAGGYKAASALDFTAAELALEKAAEAGFDTDEAVELLNSVLTLGPAESEKIASAQTFEEAIDARSLELLEQAGYPVTWTE